MCIRVSIEAKNTLYPQSMAQFPIASARCVLPVPGGPIKITLNILSIQSSLDSCCNCQSVIPETAVVSKLSKVLIAGICACFMRRSFAFCSRYIVSASRHCVKNSKLDNCSETWSKGCSARWNSPSFLANY